MSAITGWNRGTWNEGAWNTALPVTVTGVSAASAIGSAVFPITVEITGVSAASAIGSATITIPVTLTLSGVSATSVIGSSSANTTSILSVTGVSSTSAVGSVQVPLFVPVTGVSAEGLVTGSLVWSVIDDSQEPDWIEIAA